MNKKINTLLISSLIFLSGQAQAGMVRDGIWQVEEGDNLKSILKATLPEQPLRQKRLKRLSPLLNRSAFDAKGDLIVGKSLRLPGVKMPSNEVMGESEQIGRVLITNGQTVARAEDGSERTLQRGSAIKKGDTIQTQGARAQVRFSDGSLLALRPNTEFKVEEYSFNGSQDGSEKGVYSLIKGGFRTISGAIGKINKNNYQVRTPVATIGIRGTHYGVTLCVAGSCSEQGLADGLYGGVVDGSVQATNDGGSSTFGNDEYFLISDLGSLAEILLAPPGVIFDDPAAPIAKAQGADKNKKDALTKKAEKIVTALIKEKKPDFDGTLDSEQLLEIVEIFRKALQELPTGSVHPSLPGTAAAQGTVVGFSFVGANPVHSIVPTEPAVGSVARTIQHNGTTQNISTGMSAAVSAGPPGGQVSGFKSSAAAAQDMFNILRGLSYEEIIGGSLNSIASIITDASNNQAKLVEANRFNVSGTDLGLTWGRWADTPITVKTALLEESATPGTGVIFTLADASKVISSKSALESTASRIGLSGLHSMVSLGTVGSGGIAPVSFTGQRGSGSSNLTLNFGTGKAMFDVSALINNDQYTLSTAVGGVSFSDIVSPGSSASLTGACSASTGGICGTDTPLLGKASFIFTDSTPGAASGGHLGAAVNYAGHGTAPNGSTVGIAGAEVFVESCFFC